MPDAKMWDLSTAHVTKGDAERLNQGRCSTGADGIRTANHEYGWVVFCRGDMTAAERDKLVTDHGWSKALAALVHLAGRAGCILINFDQDADQYEEFPAFEW